jgi:hypothetical protein
MVQVLVHILVPYHNKVLALDRKGTPRLLQLEAHYIHNLIL